MPVCGMESGEGPRKSSRRQTCYNHRVRPDVGVVIEVNELMSEDLAVNSESYQA